MQAPRHLSLIFAAAALSLLAAGAPVFGQRLAERPQVANIVVPQARVFSSMPSSALEIVGVDVSASVVEQAATTEMTITVRNRFGARQEAELVVPVPDGAVVRGFTFQGAGKEAFAEVLPKDEARRTYESIVARMRDPALLEFAGYNMVRTSVFPVEPGAEQKVRLTYEHLLPAEGERIDYVLPRSESVGYAVPWNIKVEVRSKKPISTLFSPTHRLETKRSGAHRCTAWTWGGATREPGAFRLSCLRVGGGLTASLFAYPDTAGDGGYFLLLAGLPARTAAGAGGTGVLREVTLVLDRSGSMQGEKIVQAREAAKQIIAGLEPGETFSIIVYNDGIAHFSEEPQIKSDATAKAAADFIDTIQARGGTNLHDALAEALRPKPAEGMLPIVLFLTDGLPTVGQTSETAIRDVAIKANPHERRVFTFGVGVDVNTPLLSKIANETRAKPTFVLPQEDVEAKVGQVFKRLDGPVLAEPLLVSVDAAGEPASHRVHDMIPDRLPDLFGDDQLVVTGRYSGSEPLYFKVSGSYLGKPRSFRFGFTLDKATLRNGFVARLWASRRIGVLSDAIRQLGADVATASESSDPRVKELVEEVVRLSTEFGILTEYTAFLAREGIDLSRREEVLAEANDNFKTRAFAVRTGVAAVNQEFNNQAQMAQTALNVRNAYFNENMERVAITRIQQVNDLAFFRRGDGWIDSRIVQKESVEPDRVIEFGSPEFTELVLSLAAQGRQGAFTLDGDVTMIVNGETILVRGTDGG